MPPYLALAALRSAFVRVKENHGCAGSDGVSLTQFAASLDERLPALRAAVESGAYFAWPLREVIVEKHPGSKETRTLLVPSAADRVLQTTVARFLEPLLEAEFENCSFGYRRGRGVLQAVRRVHYLWRQGYRWLLDADIDSFFANVDRERVLSCLAPLVHDELALRLVRLWLDYAVWNGLRLHRPDLDLPLGAVVSPMLANLLLDDLDEALLGAGLEMVRYAGRVTLKPEAFRRWLEGYEAALTEARASAPLGVRAALAAEAEKFARALRENGTFQPWREIRCSMSSPMTSPTATAAGVCSSR